MAQKCASAASCRRAGSPSASRCGSRGSRRKCTTKPGRRFRSTRTSTSTSTSEARDGNNLGRAFDVSNGFAMHWAGVNVSYPADPVGGHRRPSLRSGCHHLHGLLAPGSDSAVGLQYVSRHSYPGSLGGGQVQLDLGKFDTWIGAEVADSQYNMTTRAHPFLDAAVFHTGLRIDYARPNSSTQALHRQRLEQQPRQQLGKTFGAAWASPRRQWPLPQLHRGPGQNDVEVRRRRSFRTRIRAGGTSSTWSLISIRQGARSRQRRLRDREAQRHVTRSGSEPTSRSATR